MTRPFRIAVVNSHPIQYFAPLYAHLNKDPHLELTVLYCSNSSLRGGIDAGFKQTVKWDVDLLAGYQPVFLGVRSDVLQTECLTSQLKFKNDKEES